MKFYDKKKSSRPAGTETTAKKCENEKDSHKDYTTRVKEMQVVVAIFAIIILVIITIFTAIDVFAQGNVELRPVEHKVTYGDTLWDIAKEYKPDNMTMDRYMAWVYEHNEGGYIYPGDTVIMAEVSR